MKFIYFLASTLLCLLLQSNTLFAQTSLSNARVSVELQDRLVSDEIAEGTEIHGILADDIVIEGKMIVRRGTPVLGTIITLETERIHKIVIEWERIVDAKEIRLTSQKRFTFRGKKESESVIVPSHSSFSTTIASNQSKYGESLIR